MAVSTASPYLWTHLSVSAETGGGTAVLTMSAPDTRRAAVAAARKTAAHRNVAKPFIDRTPPPLARKRRESRSVRKRKNQRVEGSFLSHAFIAQAERSPRTICLGSYPFQAMTATGFDVVSRHDTHETDIVLRGGLRMAVFIILANL